MTFLGGNFNAPWCSHLVNLGILFPPPEHRGGMNTSKAMEQKIDLVCHYLSTQRPQEHDTFTSEILQTQSTRNYIKYTKLDISNMATKNKNHNLYAMWLHF